MRRTTGFTLVEILIVVVIAASVLMFALPASKKAQERNKYLGAVGVLSDLGMAMQSLQTEASMQGSEVVFPEAGSSATVLSVWQNTSNGSYADALQNDLASLNSTIFPYALFAHGYLQSIPNEGTGTNIVYQGYSFTLCPSATSDGSVNNVVAIMQTGNSTTYQGARYFRDGTVEQISDTNPSCLD